MRKILFYFLSVWTTAEERGTLQYIPSLRFFNLFTLSLSVKSIHAPVMFNDLESETEAGVLIRKLCQLNPAQLSSAA
jgi:hypothetical protein